MIEIDHTAAERGLRAVAHLNQVGKWLRMPLLQAVPQIVKAIEETRMIRVMYHHKERILEPHDHGVLNGSVQLLGYQIDGSSNRPLPNWVLMKTDEMSDLTPLNQTFPGGRPTAKGEHIEWDVLFIRVKPAHGSLRASAR